ncbi:MAG: TrkH family potassium uptake protein, partial [Desulfobacteraceae bacterium]|nr:TrkH family potassium uptake protein [Desulfobacteraceae bacterium]
MRWRYISGIVSIFLLVLALIMATPLVVSLIFRDGAQISFLWSMGITAVAGLLLKLLSRHMDEDARFINQKEG